MNANIIVACPKCEPNEKAVFYILCSLCEEQEMECHCTTVILRDGVHCKNCGRVYKSRRTIEVYQALAPDLAPAIHLANKKK